jgi:hypothetical protein
MTEILAQGINGHITVDDEWVTLHPQALNARLRIPIASISGVQWIPAGAETEGLIELTIPGGSQAHHGFGTQAKKTKQNENIVTFLKSEESSFLEVRQFLEKRIAELAISSAPVSVALPATPNLADQLGRLKALRDRGVLSQEKFNEQTAELLAQT